MDAKATRSFSRPIAALAAVGALLLTPALAGAAGEQARTADSFVDSIGVNVHTSYDDSPYGTQLDAIRAKLVELGVRHVRDGLELDRPDQYTALNALAGAGIRSTLIVGEPDVDEDEFDELIATLGSSVRGAVEAVEGANEIDMRGDTSQLPALAGYQRDLYDAVKGDSSLATLPVLGPSLVQKRNQEALGDVSGALDYGNIHPYPDAEAPEGNLDAHLGRAAVNSGAKPVMATETGYHTALGWGGEHNPVTEEDMATYMPRLYLEYFRRGIARTFSYELIDQNAGSADLEDNFGLLRNDFSEKPAFTALRNTIDVLEDRGPTFSPASVAYSLGGESKDVHHLLLQKSDGAFYLALWRAAEASAPGSRVTLSFGRQVTAAEAYLPNDSSAPAYSLPASASGSLGLDVGPRVTILKLALGARNAAPGRIRLWVAKRSLPAPGRLAMEGRLPKQVTGRSMRFKIQRRQPRWKGWRTVGHGRTSSRGIFRKSLRLAANRRGVSRFRVVASVAKPSRPVRVRIR